MGGMIHVLDSEMNRLAIIVWEVVLGGGGGGGGDGDLGLCNAQWCIQSCGDTRALVY